MQNIFSKYPSVYYQILILFFVEQICYSQTTFDLTSLTIMFGFETPNLYKPLIISLLYIISGFIVVKIKDFKKGIIASSILLTIGFISSSFDFESYHFLYFIGGILSQIGHGMFLILCLIHIGMFFPVANDWKDFAFTIYFIIPFFGTNFYYLLLHIKPEFIGQVYSIGSYIFILCFALLFFMIFKFKHLGFSIESIEENIDDDYVEEKKLINKVMFGIVLSAFVFYFISENLHNLFYSNFNEYYGWDKISSFFQESFSTTIIFLVLSLIIFSWILFLNAKHKSSHFKKLYFIIFLFLGMIGIAFSRADGGSNFLGFSYPFIYQLMLVPIFLSIMTHVNLDQKIGVWLGALLAIPYLVDQFMLSFYFNETLMKALPYIAVLLLIIVIVVIFENRKFIEEKLELNEPNREEEDGENGIDIIEHLIPK